MPKYSEMNKSELSALYTALKSEYEAAKAKGLSLNMARGVPSPEQLDLSEPMLALSSITKSEDGTDCRNYGLLDGITEAKRLLSCLLDVAPENIFVGGNASLNIMNDMLSFAMLYGTPRSESPWCMQAKRKFLCPTPGYDRHFAITEHMGFELIAVAMTENGPDMDAVEELIKDPDVKGIWCVPKYSNPTGCVYSDETVRRMAAMKPAAPDFIIMWDNAYAVHDLYPDAPVLLNLMDELKRNGNEHMALFFGSTAKITFAGGGISGVGACDENLAWIKQHMSLQTISYDKLSQLRHSKFLPDMAAIKAHMAGHAAILAPKFEMLQEVLKPLAELGIAEWSNPQGGYFVSIDITGGSAKRVFTLMKEAGVVMTPAGAVCPYGKDPHDRSLRIAPSFPSPEDLRLAGELMCICVKLACAEALIEA